MTIEYLEYFCPSCDYDTEHEILKEEGNEVLLVKCRECGIIHKVKRKAEREMVNIKTIAEIKGGQSYEEYISFYKHTIISVGVVFAVPKNGIRKNLEITSIDTGNRKVDYAKATDISTLWGRYIDSISIKIYYHSDNETEELFFMSNCQEDYIIGRIYYYEQLELRITHIKLNDGTMLSKEGQKASAREIKCIYGKKAD